MQDNKPLGAQISHMLKDRGVDVIFGIPGVHNQEMYRGIEEAGITHVLARHEQGAGFMADGYARATGKPGVAYVITGPGFCNAMTPMGQAYSDSVPVLMVSSCLDDVATTRGQLHQMLDQRGAGAAVCEWSEQAVTADAAYALIDRAFVEFETARSRSKAIHVPIHLLEATAPPAPKQMGRASTPNLASADAATLSKLIANSERPLIILGGGCADAGTADLLTDELDGSGIAVFMTYAGGGLVKQDYDLNFETYLGRPGSADVIASADLVIAIGTELAEVDLWRDNLGHQGTLVRVDIDPEVLCDRHRADVQILGDAHDALKAILKAAPRERSKWDADQVATLKAGWRQEVELERPGIVAICDALQEALPDDTMIYSDMTQFAYVAKEVWPMKRPGHWHHPTGFGTLGYAMPAAIGGAMGRHGLPTLAIAGDYGFQYTLQELGAAVEMNLSLPIILWDNGKLKEIEDSMRRAQIAPNAVIAHNPDFVKLAQAYGASAVAPKNLSELRSRVVDAFSAAGPTLIYVTPDITD